MNSEANFRLTFGVLVVILLAVRAVSAAGVRRAGERLMPNGKAIEREGKAAFAVRFVGFFVLVGVLVAYALDPPWMRALLIPLPPWLRWAGFALGLAGIALLAWTQILLGRHWSAQLQLREQHALITTGAYARVRHPLYTGMLVFGAGFALLTAHWLFALFELSMIIFLPLRIPKEEAMLIEEFGDEYRQYMQRTGPLLPKL
jgi:protein-S-isoprenylcysteine O-methyltransferase Ste14